jgi:hypothetical protein
VSEICAHCFEKQGLTRVSKRRVAKRRGWPHQGVSRSDRQAGSSGDDLPVASAHIDTPTTCSAPRRRLALHRLLCTPPSLLAVGQGPRVPHWPAHEPASVARSLIEQLVNQLHTVLLASTSRQPPRVLALTRSHRMTTTSRRATARRRRSAAVQAGRHRGNCMVPSSHPGPGRRLFVILVALLHGPVVTSPVISPRSISAPRSAPFSASLSASIVASIFASLPPLRSPLLQASPALHSPPRVSTAITGAPGSFSQLRSRRSIVDPTPLRTWFTPPLLYPCVVVCEIQTPYAPQPRPT